MVSDSEHSVEGISSEKSLCAKMASDSENSEIARNHDENSDQLNVTRSDVDQLAVNGGTSNSDSDSDNDGEITKNAKNDARINRKTKGKEEEEEDVFAGNKKYDVVSSEEEDEAELPAKCATPVAKISLIPTGQLLNSAAKKSFEQQSKIDNSKNVSVHSISSRSEDSEDCMPSTSRSALKKKQSAIVTTVSSDSADEAPLRSRSTRISAMEKAEKVRPKRRAATKKAIIDISGESSESESSDESGMTPKYHVKAREIKMPDCNLREFQSAKVSLVHMNLPKLLEKHNLSEVRNLRQKTLVRRKSNGETVSKFVSVRFTTRSVSLIVFSIKFVSKILIFAGNLFRRRSHGFDSCA